MQGPPSLNDRLVNGGEVVIPPARRLGPLVGLVGGRRDGKGLLDLLPVFMSEPL